MYNDFKTANYNNALMSPELYARHLSRLLSRDVFDGLTVTPGTGLQVVLAPGNTFVRYGSAAVASARLVSLVANFNLTITTADVSNPRIDVVVIFIDTSVTLATNTADGVGAAKAIVVAGTPNASPTAPSVGTIQTAMGGSYPYTIVAQVRVDAGVSVIAGNKITDVRSMVYSTAIRRSTDTNGWTVTDFGSFKEYTKQSGPHSVTSLASLSSTTITTVQTMPVGTVPNALLMDVSARNAATTSLVRYLVGTNIDPTSGTAPGTFSVSARNVTGSTLTDTDIYIHYYFRDK